MNASNIGSPKFLQLAVIVTVVLLPFLLVGRDMEAWVATLVQREAAREVISVLLVLVLCVDVLLPIPSSIVATVAGQTLGFASGTAAVWCGLTMGSLLGYLVGRGVIDRLFGLFRSTDARPSTELSTTSLGMVAATRGVPVLAESVTLLAGANRLAVLPFLITSALANLGVAMAYAWVGARASSTNSFLLAFAGSVAIPGLAWGLSKRVRQRWPVRRTAAAGACRSGGDHEVA